MLVVCTGNTCRSVMAAVMIEHHAAQRHIRVSVASAGTHAVDGVPVGARTLSALRTLVELEPSLGEMSAHRSRQLGAGLFDGVDLVVAMETAHVRFVRKRYPAAAGRTGMLRPLVRDLPADARPLTERIGSLRLEQAELDPDTDVADPAGREDEAYVNCAADLWGLCASLVDRL